MTPVQRLIAAAAVVATLFIAVIGWIPGAGPLRALGVSLFLLVTVGAAPALLIKRLTPPLFVVLSVAISLAITTGAGMVMAEFNFWHPIAFLGLISLGAVAILLRSVPRDLRELRRAGISLPGRWAWMQPQWAVNTAAVIALQFVAAGALADRTNPQPGGLLSEVGPVWYLGVLGLIGCIVWARKDGCSPALPVLMLGTCVVLSQVLVYGGPTVMSAARHIGVAEYIRVNQYLNPGMDIYQAWPGLFAGTALLADAGGIVNAIVVATWWPVLLSTVLTLVVRILAGIFVRSSFRAWMAALLFTLANTLNITYYSPQSVGLLLALTILVLAFRPGPFASVSERRSSLGLMFFLACAAVVTHQISPYMAVAALSSLVLFRLIRPWWLPAIVAVPAVIWAIRQRGTLGPYLSIGAVGKVFQNVTPPTHAGGAVPFETRLVFWIPATVLVLVGIIAVVATIQRRDRMSLGLLATAASPTLMIVLTNYGQEGIFRVVLFALPWLAIAAARVEWPPCRRRLEYTGLAAAVTVLTAVNAYGQTGLDWARIVRPDAATATQIFESTAPDGASLLLTGTGNATPSKVTARYGDVLYVPRDSIMDNPPSGAAYDPAADVDQMTRAFVQSASWSTPSYYALVSDSIGGYDQSYGMQQYDDYLRLAHAMASDPAWELVFRGDTTSLYRLRDPSTFLTSDGVTAR